MPRILVWAIHLHVLGANPAVWMYGGGAGFFRSPQPGHRGAAEVGHPETRLGLHHGAPTEPDIGSDVGTGRTKAVKQDDGSAWHRRREAVHHLRRLR